MKTDVSAARVRLKPGREKSVHNHHPWLFSGAIAGIAGEFSDGDVVEVVDHEGAFLARGYLNRRSQITVRLLTWDEDEPVDAQFWKKRLERAIHRRAALMDSDATTAFRLVHAESDQLPGLVVDYYAGYVVVQSLTLGVEKRKSEVVTCLVELLEPVGIYERSDVDIRGYEGLEPASLTLWGQEPPDLLPIRENGYSFWVDLKAGQKTGFYLDQRENRARVCPFSANRSVLNAFAYTGGFGVHAAVAGAREIVHVDTSPEALGLARRNLETNSPTTVNEYVIGDVFAVLRKFRAEGRRFDVIVLDPPKFAQARGQVKAACRGYQDINRVAMQLLAPNGILFTMSCSGVVSAELFQKVVFAASVEAQRDAQIIGHLSQGADHPVLLSFPEGDYLKGLICRMV